MPKFLSNLARKAVMSQFRTKRLSLREVHRLKRAKERIAKTRQLPLRRRGFGPLRMGSLTSIEFCFTARSDRDRDPRTGGLYFFFSAGGEVGAFAGAGDFGGGTIGAPPRPFLSGLSGRGVRARAFRRSVHRSHLVPNLWEY